MRSASFVVLVVRISFSWFLFCFVHFVVCSFVRLFVCLFVCLVTDLALITFNLLLSLELQFNVLRTINFLSYDPYLLLNWKLEKEIIKA